jgi:hypothetical protein
MKNLTSISESFENSINELTQHIEQQTTIYALLNSRLTRLPSDIAAEPHKAISKESTTSYIIPSSAATHISQFQGGI